MKISSSFISGDGATGENGTIRIGTKTGEN